MARTMIMRAIEVGAPAYNAGDADRCAQIYSEAAAELIRTRRSELRPSVAEALADALDTSTALGSSLSHYEASQLAWAFRKAFDEQLTVGNCASVPAVIDRAIQEGVPLFNSGDAAGCERKYLAAAQELVTKLGDEASADLRSAIHECRRLPSANARAWALRRALDATRNSSVGGPSRREREVSEPYSASVLRDFRTNLGLEVAGRIVNDTVMGGSSQSELVLESDGIVFQGLVTRRGGGGFASARFDVAQANDLRSRLERGQGLVVVARRLQGATGWKLQLNTRGGTQWQADFTAADAVSEVRVPFASMVPTFRGRPTASPGLDKEEIANVSGFGFMLSFLAADGSNNALFQEGPFALLVSSVGVY